MDSLLTLMGLHSLVNVTDMDGFQELMTSPAVVEWDTANNTVDVIYPLEQMG